MKLADFLLKASELHVKIATAFDKLDHHAKNIDKLADNIQALAREVSVLKGMITGNTNPEIVRQLGDVQQRLAVLETWARLQGHRTVAPVVSAPPLELPSTPSGEVDS